MGNLVQGIFYFLLGACTLLFGIHIFRERKVGVHAWQGWRRGYKSEWLPEKPSQIAGITLAVWGGIFVVDAVRVMLTGQIPVFCYLWGLGWILWTVAVNWYAHKYVVKPEDRG